MILAYLKIVLPVMLLIIVLIRRFKDKFNEICSKDDYLSKENCEYIKHEILFSLIVALVPVLNILVFLYWLYKYFIYLDEDPIVMFINDKISNSINTLMNLINKYFINGRR